MSIRRDVKQHLAAKFFFSRMLGMAREVQRSRASRRGEKRLVALMQPQEASKPLKLERQFDGKTMVVLLIGRIRAEDLAELKKHIDESAKAKVLDLSEITIVDADVIRFLSVIEREGTPLMACPPYVREWILRERAEEGV
jgi:hypothetical protein